MPDKKIFSFYVSAFVLLTSLWLIHYGIKRSETLYLLGLYGVGWLAYFKLTRIDLSPVQILVLAALTRLILFWGYPNLSDDFYRFIWDGSLTIQGINPFAHTPQQVVDHLPNVQTNELLFQRLNSPSYFTIYPAISQYIFALSAIPDSILGSMWVLRMIILVFEGGTIYLLIKYFGKSQSSVAIYALNPLVILELTGNLHLEGIMLFFILLAMVLVERKKTYSVGPAWVGGIAIKFNPLMYLPILIKKTGWKNSLITYVLVVFLTVLVSIPFLDASLLKGLSHSLPLFFEKFEFNAGLFFLVRQVGFWLAGFDVVYIAGPIMSGLALLLIVWVSFFKNDKTSSLSHLFTIVLTIQLFLSTTVHPWYIIPLIAYSVATGYKFPILWSLAIILSYVGYTRNGYDHPLYLIYLEYLSVAILAWRELIITKRLTSTYV